MRRHSDVQSETAAAAWWPRGRSSRPRAGRPRRRSRAEAPAGDCVVGVSWNNYQEERWAKWDEPAHQGRSSRPAGGTYISNDAKSSSDTQASNVDALINQGAKVVIILAQDGTAIKPAVKKALDAGVPVIAYDRLIEDTGAFYITFDNVLVGKLQAEALLKVKSSGNFVVIKGNKADANADFLRAGMVQAGLPKVGESSRQAQERRRDLHRQLGSGQRPERDGPVPDQEQQQDRHRLR